jgi:uncharacterized protein with HEPN domain
MSRDPALALDILLAAEDARDFTASLDRDAFGASRLHQAAVIRCLEIMGEAAGRTSPHFRAAHPAIPWRLMSDLRNRLIHGYAPRNGLIHVYAVGRPRHRLGRGHPPSAAADRGTSCHRPARRRRGRRQALTPVACSPARAVSPRHPAPSAASATLNVDPAPAPAPPFSHRAPARPASHRRARRHRQQKDRRGRRG